MIIVPDAVRRKASEAGATRWLAELPAVIADLERAWSITVGRPLGGGTEALVAEAVLDGGAPAVLKLSPPQPGDVVRHEITALRLAGGDGCARLLRADEPRGAMLLERLGAPLAELALPPDRCDEILCATARRIWRPAAGCGLPTGADKGRWLIAYITATWPQLGRPCSERAVEHAIACAERRIAAHDDDRAVLVHGDIHPWNALQADGGFKLVDPDGLLAEPAYDLGVVMRTGPIDPADPQRRARRLADLSGLDLAAIWEWSVVERVSTGLTCLSIELPAGRELLATADQIALP
jgi:streptomycin 6-kinase